MNGSDRTSTRRVGGDTKQNIVAFVKGKGASAGPLLHQSAAHLPPGR